MFYNISKPQAYDLNLELVIQGDQLLIKIIKEEADPQSLTLEDDWDSKHLESGGL